MFYSIRLSPRALLMRSLFNSHYILTKLYSTTLLSSLNSRVVYINYYAMNANQRGVNRICVSRDSFVSTSESGTSHARGGQYSFSLSPTSTERARRGGWSDPGG